MKNKIILLAIIIMGYGCNTRKEVIKDVTAPQTLMFISESINPSNYKLTVEADIDGEVSINNRSEIMHIPKGKHTLSVLDDQYSDTLYLEYVPKGVTKGSVLLYYDF